MYVTLENEAAFLAEVRSLSTDNRRSVLSYVAFLKQQERGSDEEVDETEYLLRLPKNRKLLLQSVANIEAGVNLVIPDQTPFQ